MAYKYIHFITCKCFMDFFYLLLSFPLILFNFPLTLSKESFRILKIFFTLFFIERKKTLNGKIFFAIDSNFSNKFSRFVANIFEY